MGLISPGGENLLDFLELRQVLSTYDGDLTDPLWWPQERPVPISRREYWSGVPLPSPMHESEKWKWSRSVVSDSQRLHGLQPTRLPHPWDSPGKNTGVGCHFLLQCTKVKSESEVTQSCPTLSDLMDCSLPGSSAHGIFQARMLEWGAIAFSART